MAELSWTNHLEKECLNFWCRSRRVYCGFPILHASLLQDLIRNSSENDVTKFLDEIESNFDDVINQKDPLHGDTAMHVALISNQYEVLKKMIRQGGDILIGNNSGDSIETLLERRIQESVRRRELENRSELLRVVQTCVEVNRNPSKARVWREQLMHKAVRKNQVSISSTLCSPKSLRTFFKQNVKMTSMVMYQWDLVVYIVLLNWIAGLLNPDYNPNPKSSMFS